MEILLTDEEVVDARTNAEVAVWARHGDISEQIQAGTEAVLRAQVLKVVEWLKQNNCAPLQAEGTRTYAAHLVLPKESWQVLKAAGGEG